MENIAKQVPFRFLNGNTLKMIAIISMLIDHTAVALIENYAMIAPYDMVHGAEQFSMWQNADWMMRKAGRLAFPIFCFLLVEGFQHTRNVKRYGGRLFMFALISEIPFNLAVFRSVCYPEYQNVYFTLLLGLLAMEGMRRLDGVWWKQLIPAFLCCFLAKVLQTDYGAFGVLLIVVLYMLRHSRKWQAVAGTLLVAWEITAPLAFIPILMYDGTRGKAKLKWISYVFYPAHLFLLAVVQAALWQKGI